MSSEPEPKSATGVKRRAARPARLSAADYRALSAFRQGLRQFLAFSEEGARKLGLTPQQHQALLAIKTHDGPEPMSIGELADCLMIRNHSAVGLVNRMAERGLILRDVSASDRRRIILFLTPVGEQILDTISRDNLAELRCSSAIFADLVMTLRRIEES